MTHDPSSDRDKNVPVRTIEIDTDACRSPNGRSDGPDVHTMSRTRHPSPAARSVAAVEPAPVFRASATASGSAGCEESNFRQVSDGGSVVSMVPEEDRMRKAQKASALEGGCACGAHRYT